MDFAAFTTIYRTHEGNLPDKNVQFYSDDETLAHFARMASVYKAWLPLRRKLVDEAARTGVPVARAVFLQYPDDPNTYTLATEYMVGADVLVAPVTSPGVSTWQAYLPAGDWVHLWSGTQYSFPYQGSWVTVDAPIGQPPVFYRRGSQDGQDLQEKIQDIGAISPE
jgi:alpha-glucosidase